MTDEKPKHKPQQKHTLSEVLKSLQDLIRADLIPAQEPPPPRPSPASDEPDSFQNALDTLDHLITDRIVEPAARAAQAPPEPPEPLLPEETLEIEWEDSEDVDFRDPEDAADDSSFDEPPADGALEPVFLDGDEPEPAADPSADNVELESIELAELDDTAFDLGSTDLSADSVELDSVELESTEFEPAQNGDFRDGSGSASSAPLDLSESFELETETEAAHLDPAAPDSAVADEPRPHEPVFRKIEPDGQHAFVFPEEPAMPGVADGDAGREPQNRSSAAPGTPHPASKPSEAARSDDAAPSTDDRLARADAPSEQRDNSADEPPAPAADSRFTVEYTVAPAAHTEAPQRAVQPSRRMDATGRAASDRTASREARPSERMSQDSRDTAPGGREPRRASASDAGTAAKTGTRPDGDEIPVLKDIADLQAPPSPPLPDAAQARDIAIRVIARLNIERRKAGEAPLDIKTIERLQQYLAEALLKRGLNRK